MVAADSTGHGVPGSLVSMLGISLLNETVLRNEVKSSSDVLEVLRDEVKATFSHSDERLLTRDGIDMAFCFIDLDTLEMQFAGANRPLLLFKKMVKRQSAKNLMDLLSIDLPKTLLEFIIKNSLLKITPFSLKRAM
ncbi:MAG: SpoIIE family protein phosphatase [Chloroflexia bacterium]|nr:SpoIIE family protein phosphatase [Chloroflexia bacterium]